MEWQAVKALGAVVEADTELLGSAEVRAGVARSLQDEAVSVREAAVDLLGRHIGSSSQVRREVRVRKGIHL